jgi:hypothetical protein
MVDRALFLRDSLRDRHGGDGGSVGTLVGLFGLFSLFD